LTVAPAERVPTGLRELPLYESLFGTIAGGMTLTGEEVSLLRSLWTPRKFRRGQFFQRAGDVTVHGGFVACGCLRTYVIDQHGRENIIYFSPERTFIGDITSAVTGRPTLYDIDAIEPSSVLTIDVLSLNRMLDTFPEIARGYRLALERAQGAQRERIARILSGSAEERYADFAARHPRLAERVPQRMLASYLGMTPETLSRIRRARRA
jgi:CRP-like cAMP-binding protein